MVTASAKAVLFSETAAKKGDELQSIEEKLSVLNGKGINEDTLDFALISDVTSNEELRTRIDMKEKVDELLRI